MRPFGEHNVSALLRALAGNGSLFKEEEAGEREERSRGKNRPSDGGNGGGGGDEAPDDISLDDSDGDGAGQAPQKDLERHIQEKVDKSLGAFRYILAALVALLGSAWGATAGNGPVLILGIVAALACVLIIHSKLSSIIVQ